MAASVKAFILCDDIRTQPGTDKCDLSGAGVARIRPAQTVVSPAQLLRHTLWVYAQLVDDKAQGRGRLALMRADSGRRVFFREMDIQYADPLTPTTVVVRMFQLEFPERGVYFVEFWYDDEWLIDQRLEIV